MSEFLALLTRVWPFLLGGAVAFGWLVRLLWQGRGLLGDIKAGAEAIRAELSVYGQKHGELRELVIGQHAETKERLDDLESGVHALDVKVAVLETESGKTTQRRH